MKNETVWVAVLVVVFGSLGLVFPAPGAFAPESASLSAAARYLDGRIDWWEHWPNAARDHDTSCISCHTALPYALARPALHQALKSSQQSAAEERLIGNVVKRVRLWNEVEPFYPDQRLGLPKTSESRGTEAVLNALILSRRDAQTGKLGEETQQAFSNMWALQFTIGSIKGAWAWLDFHLEPWESTNSAYFGAALAAVAVGSAPQDYVSTPQIHGQVELLRGYLQKVPGPDRLFDRAMVLWASSKLSDLLTADQRQSIINSLLEKQEDDGGWAMSQLGAWKRSDGTPADTSSDGYATGLVTYALERSGVSAADDHVRRGLLWLSQHQDIETGMWFAASLNKKRDPASDAGKFMNDAATAYAVLALTNSN